MLVRKENRIRRISESTSSPKSVKLGGYSWAKIGELNGHSLYLCDKIIKRMPFNRSARSNDWKESDIRYWLNSDFYSSLSQEEKSKIVPFDGDMLFLLSRKEYYRFSGNIHKIKGLSDAWWLRSPGDRPYEADDVEGVLPENWHIISDMGVRPAFLMKD